MGKRIGDQSVSAVIFKTLGCLGALAIATLILVWFIYAVSR